MQTQSHTTKLHPLALEVIKILGLTQDDMFDAEGDPILTKLKLTKRQAKQLLVILKLNEENRKLNGCVNNLTREMNAGEWVFNPQQILVLKANGFIGDFGHRLTSFCNSTLNNLKIYFTVGWTDEAISVMDSGKNRTVLNQLHMKKDSAEATGFMVQVSRYSAYGDKDYSEANSQRLTPGTAHEFVTHNFKALAELEVYKKQVTSGLSILGSAVVWRAFLNYFYKYEDALDFCKAFATGVDSKGHHSMALDLRKALIARASTKRDKLVKKHLFDFVVKYMYAHATAINIQKANHKMDEALAWISITDEEKELVCA